MIEINNVNNEDINLKNLSKLAQNFLDTYNLGTKLVSIAFISKEEMKNINNIYRGKNVNTDVLSFTEVEDSSYLGEVLINYAKIKEQALEFNNSFQQELNFILVHGLLHLLGYTDEKEEDKNKMIKLGKTFLSNYNYQK